MLKKVSTDLNFNAREGEVLDFWKKNDIFKKSMKLHEGAQTFTFYDGPPTANGRPHIGHIITRVMKDIVLRYKTMKGYDVLRKAGWDTHGLPVELEVEKLLGLDGKPQIEEYGVEPFIEECKKSVWKYKSEWEKMSDRVGYWADMEDPYVTYDNNYIESEWWSLKTLWDKGLLYKGHRVVPYCPRCGTALSSHEVAQGYKDVKETSVFVKFKVEGEENTYILAWTTTPWTLPSNVALCVNPHETYVKVKFEGEYLIMAQALVPSVLGEGAEEVEVYAKGEDLKGMRYQPLFPYAKVKEGSAWFVVADDYVTLSDGTGVVHTAPAFGEDDARVGRDNNLPFVQMVDAQGKFVEGCEEFTGMFVKDADPVIIERLKAEGKLFRALEFEHSYPFCWRCDTPLLYYARSSWFVKMTAVRDRLMEINRSVNWMPENIKEGRMGNFLENVIDWGLSRERYWGTPLPIWECECGHTTAIGSIAELREKAVEDVPEDIELHKPYIDRVHIRCEKCGKPMTRVPEVIDCWYDSGSMPFAQWHYPFENQDKFKQRYPADYITEAVDQTRGWFYVLLAISTAVFDHEVFKNCIVLGHVNDKDGLKMSKHKGNVVDPWTVLDKQGADAVRWYFFTNSAPWLPSRFYEEAVSEAQRRFMGTLWNTYAFFALYAGIDQFDPTGLKLADCKLNVMDRWILSRLSSLITAVDKGLEEYHITETARMLEGFVDDLSNWYVRRCRERFWGKGMTEDKQAAFMTLYTVLVEFSKLAAPYVPFMAESMYQNLVRSFDESAPESVHLCDFPKAVCPVDEHLEQQMQEVMDLVALGRSARNTAALKNRQPLSAMYVMAPQQLDAEYAALMADELNVKKVAFVSDAREFTTYTFKPQLRTVGPKYGKLVGAIGKALQQVDGNAAMEELNAGKALELEVNGQHVSLAKEDLLIDTANKPGYVAQAQGEFTVALDTNLTEDLIEEGLVREMISKAQTQRREAGFEVTDHIALDIAGDEKIDAVLAKFGGQLAADVLCDALQQGKSQGGVTREWNINGIPVKMTAKVL
ncbi:Isoleucine--tRNA ligase [uncultured Clostridium sp.]|nr:Isoleucine--tRNA ligase [uncultured Clostridium sp.]